MKATKWSLTHWLTEGRSVETLNALVQQMPQDWHLEGQIEQGVDSQQNLHAQLYLKTPQTRGTRVAKFFPHTHIEEARNGFALPKYVHKKDTAVAEFKTVENRSPQWHIVRDKFYEWYVETYPEQLVLKVDDEERLKYWDRFIGLSLEDGMNVDVIGVNPQYRSCIMKYWTFMIRRTLSRNPPTSVDKCLDKTADPPAGGTPDSVKGVSAEDASPGGGMPRVKKVIKAFLPKE